MPAVRRGTASGQDLKRQLRVAQLEQELAKLKSVVSMLVSQIDDADIAAAIRLKETSPTNEELRIWARQSSAPEDMSDKQEQRPW